MVNQVIQSQDRLVDALDQATVADIKKEQIPEPQLPDEFKGKSVAELAKEIEDSRKALLEKERQVQDLSYKFEYLDNLQRQRNQTREAEPSFQQREPEVQFDWDYDKPVDSVRKVVELERKKWEKEQTGKEQQRQAQEAIACYAEGKRTAFKQFSGLMAGIEKEVEQAVFESYRAGIISPYMMRTIDPWVTAAQLIHLRNGQIDRIKSAIQPMKASSEELPTSGRSTVGESSVPVLDFYDRETREIMEKMGHSREEAEKIVKEEQERLGGRRP